MKRSLKRVSGVVLFLKIFGVPCIATLGRVCPPPQRALSLCRAVRFAIRRKQRLQKRCFGFLSYLAPLFALSAFRCSHKIT